MKYERCYLGVNYPNIGTVLVPSYEKFSVVTFTKRRKAFKKWERKMKDVLNVQLVFEIPESEKSNFINALIEFAKLKGEENPELEAEKYYKNLLLGLTHTGEKVWRRASPFFDKRVSQATKGLYLLPENWKKFRGEVSEETKESPYVELDRSNLELNKQKPKFELITEKEKQQFETEKEALLKEYPTLNRADIRNDVELYVQINVKLKNLVIEHYFRGSEKAIKDLIDAKLKLGDFLGLSEGKRREEDLLAMKDNIASLSKQFEVTLQEFPEFKKKLRKKEIKMLLNKYYRNEIPRWMIEREEFLGMKVEEAENWLKES